MAVRKTHAFLSDSLKTGCRASEWFDFQEGHLDLTAWVPSLICAELNECPEVAGEKLAGRRKDKRSSSKNQEPVMALLFPLVKHKMNSNLILRITHRAIFLTGNIFMMETLENADKQEEGRGNL